MRQRHLAHYLEVVETAWEGILAGGEAERDGMSVQVRETDNLRAAFGFAASCDEGRPWRGSPARNAGPGSCAVSSRRHVQRSSGGRSRRRAASPCGGAERPATFALHQGDTRVADELWTKALAINREHGDHGEAARCLAELGAVAVAERDFALAHARYEETAVLFHGSAIACGRGSPYRTSPRSRRTETISTRRSSTASGQSRCSARSTIRWISRSRLRISLLPFSVAATSSVPARSCARRSRSPRSWAYAPPGAHARCCGGDRCSGRRCGARDQARRRDRGGIRGDRRGAARRRATGVRADQARVGVVEPSWQEEGRAWPLEEALDAARPLFTAPASA